MFTRQRTLISLLKAAGGRASRLHATKWAFVLACDTESGGGDAFYDFLPYEFGPFSFTMYQEAAKLCEAGLLHKAGDDWLITKAGEEKIGSLPFHIRRDVSHVYRKYGNMGTRSLLEVIYERHPWFTILSRVNRREERPSTDPAVFTAGYEGLSVDGFLNRLLKNGIVQIIDVRRNPVSRRYGFHKKTLDGLCQKLEIKYAHFPNLGIASHRRKNLDTPEAYRLLFDEYARTVLTDELSEIQEVAGIMCARPSVLVCSEKDADFCHRTPLAHKIQSLTGLPVLDLGTM